MKSHRDICIKFCLSSLGAYWRFKVPVSLDLMSAAIDQAQRSDTLCSKPKLKHPFLGEDQIVSLAMFHIISPKPAHLK